MQELRLEFDLINRKENGQRQHSDMYAYIKKKYKKVEKEREKEIGRTKRLTNFIFFFLIVYAGTRDFMPVEILYLPRGAYLESLISPGTKNVAKRKKIKDRMEEENYERERGDAMAAMVDDAVAEKEKKR
ncbi:hypothetical protein PUN28_009654 [Cardiocondyla obscurior]|uniref:Uncharacterized protein n=1 Tax=Cardiocondyla obscurior TaxID=286306 RepID=A0AAW2FUZ2_9HYME